MHSLGLYIQPVGETSPTGYSHETQRTPKIGIIYRGGCGYQVGWWLTNGKWPMSQL